MRPFPMRRSLFAVPEGRFRWWVFALLLAASFLNYFDRQALSVLKATIKGDFGLDDAGYALLVNVFTGCYAVAYLGSGWLVDRFGSRRMLALFIGVWSLATAGCGIATSFWMLAACRGLLGLAEPGLHPATLRSGTAWAPAGRRGLFLSLCGLGSSVGTVAAPPLIAWLVLHYHWRLAFVIPGLAGLIIATLWGASYREPAAIAPVEKQGAPAATGGGLEWGRLWLQPALWGIVLARLVSDPVWYFCLFWLPGYLQESRGLTLEQLGFVGWIPFAAANVGGIAAAALSDVLARRSGSRLAGRKKLLYATGLAGPLAMLLALQPSLPATLALFCAVAVICASWLYTISLVITEAFPLPNIASVWGISGAFGATGAIVFNYIIGQLSRSGDMKFLFLGMGLLHPLAALLLWRLVRKPVPAATEPAQLDAQRPV